MKTKLDLMLDAVIRQKCEITIDVRDYTREQVDRVISTVQSRGLDASSDGKWVLVRPMAPVSRPGQVR